MKRLLNLLYTAQAKTTVAILIVICSWLMNSELTEIFSLYKEDGTAVTNVLIQQNDFEYESSYFLKHEIETAIKDVLEYALVYHRNTDEAESSETYSETVERLESLTDFRFAVVNHKTDTIVSNISAINRKSSEVSVRRHFADEKNLLIVRDAKTPYFENGTMIEYVPFVSEQAKKYTDDFDIYISFGATLEFAGTSEEYSQRHSFAFLRIKESLDDITAYFLILFIMFVTLIAVSGKREHKGKYYPSLTDSLPNDIKLMLHGVVYLSMSALYENSLYMTLRVTNIENYWFNRTPEFYLLRSNFSMVVMICIITALCCTIRRQIGCGTLVTNTYIYKIIKSYKNAEPEF